MASKPEETLESKLNNLKEMGFEPNLAQEALTRAHGDLQAALDWLLSNCPQGRVGVSESSPVVTNNEPSSNFVPPPPLDASDRENAEHLAALQRNQRAPSNPPNYTPPQERYNGVPPGTGVVIEKAHPSAPSADPQPQAAPPNVQPIALSPSSLPLAPVMENAPMLLVCYREDMEKPRVAEKDRILHLLTEQHIPHRACEISTNLDLAAMLESADTQLPHIVFENQPLGDLNSFSQDIQRMRRFVACKIANSLQSEHSGAIDEYRKSSVSTGAVDGVINLLASAFWTSSAQQQQSRQAHTYIEFTVIKTNWFYRAQMRVIRFGSKDFFYRIEPTTKEVRETIAYSNIASITITSSSLALTMKDGTIHSYNAPLRVLDYMFQLFVAYAPENIPVSFAPQ